MSGDVVLAAAIGAAAHVDPHLAGYGVVDRHFADPLLDGAVETHRGGDAELATVGAGAGNNILDLLGVGRAHAEFVKFLPDRVDGLVGDPAQHDVLLRRGAGAFASVLTQDFGEAAELLRGQVALVDRGLDGRESLLHLRSDVGDEEALEAGGIRRSATGDRRQMCARRPESSSSM